MTNADYMHPKRVCKDFEIKKLGENHDFYLKNDTLRLADIFENFRQMCQRIYHLDPYLSVINWYWYAINGCKYNH